MLALFVLALGFKLDRRILDEDLTDLDKERPVSKVIKLLKDMQAQLIAEKKNDEEVYEKMDCWCKVNGQDKSAATEAAGRKLADLEQEIKALSSRASGTEQSIEKLQKELAENQEALATATALREKEAGEFHAGETDMVQNLEALKAAIVVLSKHQAFLQGSSVSNQQAAYAATRKQLQLVFHKKGVEDMLNEILNPTQKQKVEDFVQGGAPQAYQNQSGEIGGILNQLKENMEKNLSASQKEEVKAVEEFAALKAAKTEEIDATSTKLKDKSQVLAKTNQALADSKADFEDTTNSLTADQAFLLDLEKRCAAADAEWAERSKTRAAEIAAVSEAVGILASDDSHDTFGDTFNFIQMASRHTGVREHVATKLLQVAAKTGSSLLLKVAQSVKLDAFVKVKQMIADMVEVLKTQQADEVKHKDFCNEEFKQNDAETFSTQNTIDDLGTSTEALAAQIEDLAKSIVAIDDETNAMQVEMQRANENRQKQNWEFQQTVADQRATQVILKKALDRLQKFYAGALVQTQGQSAADQPAGPPPPAGFKPYEKSAGSGGALGMLESVMTDAANLEKEALAAEQDAQSAYESYMRNAHDSLDAAARARVDKVEEKATAEKAKVQAEADQKAALNEAEELSKYKASLHLSCDFVLNNFDARQEARTQEVESLKQAAAILSGAGA